MLFELVKYKEMVDLPYKQHPWLSDAFMVLKDSFLTFDNKPQLKGIISLYSAKPRRTKMEILPFYSFSTNRTIGQLMHH